MGLLKKILKKATIGGRLGLFKSRSNPKLPGAPDSKGYTPEEQAALYQKLQGTLGGRYDTINNSVLTRLIPHIQADLGARGLETSGGAFSSAATQAAGGLEQAKQQALGNLDVEQLNRLFDTRQQQFQNDLAARQYELQAQQVAAATRRPSTLESIGKIAAPIAGTVLGGMAGGPVGAGIGGQLGGPLGGAAFPQGSQQPMQIPQYNQPLSLPSYNKHYSQFNSPLYSVFSGGNY